jgi:6-phosphogluconate dehydrogenase
MVHNGIEYGLMQLIAESCDIMRRGLRMTHRAMGRMFWHWSRLPLGGYLTEITSDILEYPDPLGEGYLLDKLSDAASQHGTGSWTVQEGAVLGIPVPVIEAALAIRNLSHDGQLRPVTAQQLSGPDLPHERYIDFTTVLKRALECGMLLTYAQGLHLLRAASDSYRYRIPMASVPRIWRGGCIIRARMLERLLAAYRRDSSLVNPISDRTLDAHLGLLAPALREVVCQATRWGIPVPAFAAAIAYYDAWRTRRLPTDLIQAQRDRFGNHTFNRTDRGGFFHAAWGTTELS